MGYEHEDAIVEPWRPIDELPTEAPMGLPIIIWWEDAPVMVTLMNGKWTTDDGEEPFIESNEYEPPTYWMPLGIPYEVLIDFIEKERARRLAADNVS